MSAEICNWSNPVGNKRGRRRKRFFRLVMVGPKHLLKRPNCPVPNRSRLYVEFDQPRWPWSCISPQSAGEVFGDITENILLLDSHDDSIP